jgi:hypothetical protein
MVTGEKAMVAQVFLKKGAEAGALVRAAERYARATSFQTAQACLLTERLSTGAKQP